MSVTYKEKHHKSNIIDLSAKPKTSFSLDNLSESLILSAERSKCIYDLYEKATLLKTKSDKLTKALDEEKAINEIQGEFVSLVSHEFKTPLAIIKTSMDVIKRVGRNKNEIIDDQITKVDKAISRMTKLIESTLNLSRLESGRLDFSPEKFCLEELITDVVERFQGINAKASFQLDINLDKNNLFADKALIDQIFTNIISNSVKYSKNNPQITISCQVIENHFNISIKDDGVGMNESDLNNLFQKFFRSKNTIGISGTGIGLYLVKKFVELHHGNIIVESQENIGTKFTIFLPLINKR